MAASAAMPQHQRLILGSLYLSFTVLSRHYGTLWLQGKKSRKVMNHWCHRLHCHQCLIPGDVNLNHSGDQCQDSALEHSYYLLCRFCYPGVQSVKPGPGSQGQGFGRSHRVQADITDNANMSKSPEKRMNTLRERLGDYATSSFLTFPHQI